MGNCSIFHRIGSRLGMEIMACPGSGMDMVACPGFIAGVGSTQGFWQAQAWALVPWWEQASLLDPLVGAGLTRSSSASQMVRVDPQGRSIHIASKLEEFLHAPLIEASIRNTQKECSG